MNSVITKEQAFTRLGGITRELHEALAALGNNQLESIVKEIPNARDRLSYVGKMTEDAANKVLGLVEQAKPDCDDLAGRGKDLGESLQRIATAQDMSVEKARGLMMVCGSFARRTAEFSERQREVLSDIMMAQDFQDLSGQVIKKVIDIITRTEMQLLNLLVDTSQQLGKTEAQPIGFNADIYKLEGPQVATEALQQNDVDDLLASMGF